MPIDLTAPTERGHHWSCSACPFSTTSLALAIEHCEQASGDFPRHEHTLHELEPGDPPPSRSSARRVISCRNEDGIVLNARVYPSRARFYVRRKAA
jgi:hypothetical protein